MMPLTKNPNSGTVAAAPRQARQDREKLVPTGRPE